MDTARTQAISEGEGYVIAGSDLTDLLEVFVEEALLILISAPACHDRSSTADDTCQAVERQRDVLLPQPCMDGEVVYPLLCLLDEGISVDLPR